MIPIEGYPAMRRGKFVETLAVLEMVKSAVVCIGWWILTFRFEAKER